MLFGYTLYALAVIDILAILVLATVDTLRPKPVRL